MKKRFLLLLIFLFWLISPVVSWAQDQTLMEARIIKVLSESDQRGQISQQLEVLVKTGRFENQTVVVDTGLYDPLSQRRFEVGDQVILALSADAEGNNVFYIADYIRRTSFITLGVVFVLLVLIIGGLKGLFSLVGLGLSFAVVMFLVLPLISQGKNPILVSVLTSILMVPLLFYTSHGFNRKTTIAVVSTIVALGITGILARVFVFQAKISGLSSEEMGFLSVSHRGLINSQGLVLAGIIIGALGVLDDVTISQSAVVEKIKKLKPRIKSRKLFAESLSVGRDHIASMVNTLVLVYAGASLPLLLLFIDSAQRLSLVINYEIIAEELVRTLVGSIGLVAAIPITSFLAVIFAEEEKK